MLLLGKAKLNFINVIVSIPEVTFFEILMTTNIRSIRVRNQLFFDVAKI